eukprot:6198301-Pleurochrysis_carterae.AAC.2
MRGERFAEGGGGFQARHVCLSCLSCLRALASTRISASFRNLHNLGAQTSCIVFGSINMDIMAKAKGDWPSYDSSAFGDFNQSPGGKGANEAVATCGGPVPSQGP